MKLEIVISAFVILFVVVVMLGAVLFLVMEANDKLDTLREIAPSFMRRIEQRESLNVLLVVCLFLLLGNGYELVMKEVPEVPAPPIVKLIPPVPPPAPSLLSTGTQSPRDAAPFAYLKSFVKQVMATPGSKLGMNGYCQNVTEFLARDAKCGGNIYIVPAKNGVPSKETEEIFYKTFDRKWTADSEEISGKDLVHNDFIGGTSFADSPLLDAQVISDLDSGNKVVLIIQGAKFRDLSGKPHRTDDCTWIQPPFSSARFVWHNCQAGHNGLKY